LDVSKDLIVTMSIWTVVTGLIGTFEETPAAEERNWRATLDELLTPEMEIATVPLTRKRRERGYRREELTRFGRIPSTSDSQMVSGPIWFC